MLSSPQGSGGAKGQKSGNRLQIFLSKVTAPVFTHHFTTMKSRLLRHALLALFLSATLHAQGPQVPPLINYQGRVAVDAVNFEGAGLFKFALVNEDGSVTFWSNDGISVAGSEPTDAVSLTVAKGLYSVLLGDAALVNMTAIPASVFANPDVRLRVWFDDGVNASQLLTPDQRLAPAAYLADGAVTSASIAAGAVTSAGIAAGAISSTHVAPGSLDFSLFTVPNAPGVGQVLSFDGAGLNWVAPGSGSVSGSGTTGRIPLWTGGTILGVSAITQSVNGVQLPNGVQLAAGAQGNNVSFGSPNGETGMTVAGLTGRADIRFDGANLRLMAGPAGQPPSFGITIPATPGNIQLPNGVSLAAGAQGNSVTFGSPNSETGMTISGASGRADLRFNGILKLVAGPGGIPAATNGLAITTAGNVGIGTENPVAKLHVVGTTRTSVLTITGGADIAEPFPMKEDALEKGSVVVIDAEHPGRLKRSVSAYDTRVAGIVSGANGINAGISLRQEGVMDGGQNVALSGRVYVRADASGGAIQPGDMLTTSDVPGHAMKVGDHGRAQGAVIGKAMSALPAGRGLVLVLVTLQ